MRNKGRPGANICLEDFNGPSETEFGPERGGRSKWRHTRGVVPSPKDNTLVDELGKNLAHREFLEMTDSL